MQAGGGGLTVWASFHAGGKPDLVFLEETINQHRYRDILQQTLIPFARATFRDNFVFQDDNARPHRAHMIQDIIQANSIEHMEWPALSPDMNPIENLWAELTRQIDNLDQQPTSVAELRQALINGWRAIPGQTLQNLVDSMPRRVRALLLARGGHTKY